MSLLIWRLGKHGDEAEEGRAEKRAIFLVGITFLVLALSVTYEPAKR